MSDCEKYNNGFDLLVLEDISETPVSTVFSNGHLNVNAFFIDGINSICLPEVEEMFIPWYVFGSDVVEINNNHFGVVYFK